MQIEKGIDKEVKKIRLMILDKPGYMGKVATAIGNAGGSIGDIRLVGGGLESDTPDVAKVCRVSRENPERAHDYTGIGNTVAIVTNGTAILGLGDIGAVAGMPVMEGKAVLFDGLVGVSGVPILIQSKDSEEIIRTVAAIAPTFGAIKLEDIKAPECSEIEDGLSARRAH